MQKLCTDNPDKPSPSESKAEDCIFLQPFSLLHTLPVACNVRADWSLSAGSLLLYYIIKSLHQYCHVVDRVSVKPLTEYVNKALAATNPVRHCFCICKLVLLNIFTVSSVICTCQLRMCL